MRTFIAKMKIVYIEYIQLLFNVLILLLHKKGMRVNRYPHSALILTLMPQMPMDKGL